MMRFCHQVLTIIQFLFLCMTPLLWSGCDMAAVDQVMEDETPMMTPGGTTPPLPEPAGTLVTTPEGGTMRGGSIM